jgi:hypothetical protein
MVKELSNYTITLRGICEMYVQQSTGTWDLIERSRDKIFDFDYPIFDETYRKVFETHFIRQFFMREIGFETEGYFKFRLETWLQINMPYWNKMFESELLEYNPLQNAEMDVTHNKKNDSGSTSNANQTNQHDSTTGADSNSSVTGTQFNRNLNSDNPESRLQLTAQDGVGVIEYASAIDESKGTDSRTTTGHTGGTNSSTDTSNSSANSSINETEDFIQHRIGKIGVQSFPKMIQEHRDALLRIENLIFNEMNELFMLIY